MKTVLRPLASEIRKYTYLCVVSFALTAVATITTTHAESGSTMSAGSVEAVQNAVRKLPEYIKQAMEKTGVPGLAVAIVHKDKLIYAQGFGVRSTETGIPVTPDTVFQLASVSKPLGATAVAAAISTGALSWDTPVAPLVSGFSLSNAEILSKVTVGDLYAHRSGLPGDFGNDLEQFGFDREHIFKKAYLEPLTPFRETFSYSNFGLTVAGVAAAAATGKDWEEFTEAFIFSPLGMTQTTYSHADFVKMENTASLHQKVDGRWIPGSERNADAQAPAGGANSNVLDLSRWMRMILAEGMFEDRQVVSKEALAPMLEIQIKTAADSSEGSTGYGFGMGVDIDPHGKSTWTHSADVTRMEKKRSVGATYVDA